jgi:hypothetical protein
MSIAGNGSIYCGEGCQEKYGYDRLQWYQENNVLIQLDRKCDLGDPSNRPPSVKDCGPRHDAQKCSTGDCCSSAGQCVRTDWTFGNLPHANSSRATPMTSAGRTVSQILETASSHSLLNNLTNLAAVGLSMVAGHVPSLSAAPTQAFA